MGKYGQVLVAKVAGERAVVHLAISRRQRRGKSGKVKEEVVATALVLSTKLVKCCNWIVDTRGAWICVWINGIGALVEWRSRRVRSRMRQRRVHTEYRIPAGAEKEARQQAATLNAARLIPTARFNSSKRNKETVGRNIAVPTEDPAGAFPEIGNDHDIGLVISGAGFQPCLPLAHIIGCSHLGVAAGASDFRTP